MGVALGLFIGKPVGIWMFAWLSVRTRLAMLPSELSWRNILGAGCLCGIGFTMAIFIAGLAFPGDLQTGLLSASKVGVLLGSIISAGLGALLLIRAKPGPATPAIS